MFGLFKSKREKIKQKGEKIFDNYLPGLKGMSDEEIGFVLNTAVSIKSSSTIYGSNKEYLMVFENPMNVSEDVAFGVLDDWENHVMSISNTVEGRSKAASLSIWYLSLIACQIAELRFRGKEMWAELERGFVYATNFDPDRDCVIGLETRS